MWRKIACLVLIGLTVQLDYAHAEHKRYDNYRVYQLRPKTAAHRATIIALDDSSGSLFFLDSIHDKCTKVYVVVAPNAVAKFTTALKRAKIPFELIDKNAQKSLDVEELAIENNGSIIEEYNWNKYQKLDATYDWMYGLVEKYPKQVSIFTLLGQTHEGREILGLRIEYDQSRNATGRRGIFIEGGIHAREWISPATTTYIINQLLTNRNKRVRRIAEKYVWHVIPHANPDGYVYSYTSNRLWRKNRNQYVGDSCVGVDLNRNFDVHWMEEDASNNSCADTYAGPKPFSEVETRVLAKYISQIRDELVLHLALHSYSQFILFPYGYTRELPPTYENLERVSKVAIAAFSKRYGTIYKGGTSNRAFYADSGTSTDWVYDKMNVPYTYTIELRPPERNGLWNGFVLPAEEILPTGRETLDAVVAMIEEIDHLENK